MRPSARTAVLAVICAVNAAHCITLDGASLPTSAVIAASGGGPAGEAECSVASQMQQLVMLRGGAEGSSWTGWWYKTLAKLGIFLKKGRMLVLGLDNAGKSTLLTVLQSNEVRPTAPTHQPVTDVIKVGHMKLRAVDMGGHEIARRMWLQYSHEADGIVYIVDAVDRERFEEAAIELHKLLAANALPPGAPVLILANKVDLPHAASQEELWYGLGLDELQQQGNTRPVVCRPASAPPARHVVRSSASRAASPPTHSLLRSLTCGACASQGLYLCSIFERRGYMEGFDWMAQYM